MTGNEQASTFPPTKRGWRPSIRTVLFAILAATIVLLTAVMSGIADLRERRVEKRLAATLVDGLQARVESQLEQLLRPLETSLADDLERVRSGGLPRYRPEELVRLLLPRMRHLRGVESMMIGDEQGHQLLLMRWSEATRRSPLLAGIDALPPVPGDRDLYFTRDFRPGQWGSRSRWTLWSETGDTALASWEVELPDYDPRQRPWHQQALQRLQELESTATSPPTTPSTRSPIAWTDVYTMFTTKTAGVSASAATRAPDGTVTIIAYDLLLDDLRSFVASLSLTPNSHTFLCTANGESLALPGAAPATLLQPIAAHGPPAVRAWHERWRARGSDRGSSTFDCDGAAWWGSWLPLVLGDARVVWLGVAISRVDLLRLAGHEHDGTLSLLLIASVVALGIASLLAWRVQRPLRDVVAMSRDLGSLRLHESTPPRSRIAELDELIGALTATRAQLRAHIAARDHAAAQLAQREAQLQQAQRLEAVGRLAGGIAHDFNNLLTGMLGHLELLRERSSDAAATDVDAIERAIHSGAALVRQLLTFARRDRPEPRVLDLAVELRDSELLLRRLLPEDLELQVTIGPGRHVARIDPTQLQQVIVNLVINARDAMASAGVLRIELAAVAGTTPPQLELRVSDDGCGMDEETQRRAFEPFFSGKATGEGSGLGLTTCYGIVSHAGGRIRIESAPGHGTMVQVLLPACDEPPTPRLTLERSSKRGEGTVLCVEDDDAIRELARRTLTAHGYRVLCAARGSEALQLAERHPELDLLLTDVVMPGMSGGELASLLRAQRPQLPVLFVSGYSHDGLHDRIPGGAQLLAKPYTPAELLQRIAQLLAAARAN